MFGFHLISTEIRLLLNYSISGCFIAISYHLLIPLPFTYTPYLVFSFINLESVWANMAF